MFVQRENEQLSYELEGYKNEAYMAKEEAERKFEKFKAHFIAQQALQNNKVTLGYVCLRTRTSKVLLLRPQLRLGFPQKAVES